MNAASSGFVYAHELRSTLVRILKYTAASPAMFAFSDEALVMRVTTLLEVSGVKINIADFYRKHLPNNLSNNALSRPKESEFEPWAIAVINHALELLNGH